MDWFQGTIGEAIQTAKLQKARFVVVIHGDDAVSQKFLETIDDPEINSKLQKPNAICIKLQNSTQACNQFSALYPVILVPSMYFINSQDGKNIETTGGSVTKENIIESINKAFEGVKIVPASPVETETAVTSEVAADIASPRNERFEQARQHLNEAVQESNDDQSPSTPTTTMTLDERVERAKRLLAEKQAQKAKEADEKEKTSEMERRELGKNLAEMKKKREEDEIRQAAEERRQAKVEERIALQKVKEQIAQDRAEKTERFNREKNERDEKRKELEKEKLIEEARKAEQLLRERSTVARIQFKLPNGVSKMNKFEPEDTIDDLYTYVMNEIENPYGSNVSLQTTFPLRELDQEPRTKSLRDAGLVPSSTVLILPKNRGTISTNPDGIMGYIWLLLTPITVLWGIISSFVFGSDQTNAATGQANARQTGNQQGTQPRGPQRRGAGIKTDGNIARLSADDDDDENNTWNGNSTQQM